MDDAAPDERLQIGGNYPPSPMTPQELLEDLKTRYDEPLKLAIELLATGATIPLEIKDDDTQGKAADLVNKMRALEQKLEMHWTVEAEPFEAKLGVIRATFNNPQKDLQTLRIKIGKITTAYTQFKRDQKRKALAEETERLRQVEAENLRLATNAENTKIAAAAAITEYERLINEARIASAGASTVIEKAGAALKTAKAVAGKIRADMLAQAADYAGREKNGEKLDEAEKKASGDKFRSAIRLADAAVSDAQKVLDDATAEADAALQRERDLAAAITTQTRIHNSAARDVETHFNQASRTERRADRVEEAAEKPGLGQVRSEFGSLTTLTKHWKATVIDYNKLPKELIWPHIQRAALDAAVTNYMNSLAVEQRQCPGAVFEEEEVGMTRR